MPTSSFKGVKAMKCININKIVIDAIMGRIRNYLVDHKDAKFREIWENEFNRECDFGRMVVYATLVKRELIDKGII